MGRIVAIDYGRKRTGLAVTDEGQQFAFALETVASHELLKFLEEYSRNNPVDAFVVGEPKRLNNTPNEATELVEAFVRSLKRRFVDIPVHRVDERFTSVMAKKAIIDSGIGKKERRDKALVDKVSAAIILQSWLEQRDLRAGL